MTDNRVVAEPVFVRFDDVKSFELAAGVIGRPLFGAGAMINLIELEPDAVVPLHSHPHEQIGYVVRGAIQFTIGERVEVLRAGDGYVIPGGVPHSCLGLESSLAVDVFAPVRDEYKPQ